MSFLSGFIAIIGPPNTGKSTLLNRLLGEKIAITSPRPQTTRNRIIGVYSGEGYQMVFMDTPGIHKTKSLLHESMVGSAKASLKEVDIILLIIGFKAGDFENEIDSIVQLLKKANKPVILAINKIDLARKEDLLPIIDSYSKLYRFDSIIPISALYGDGVETLKEELRKRLYPGPQFFPPNMITDKPRTFLIAEVIREKIYHETKEELPYCSAVVIEGLEEHPERNLLAIMAVIYVEKDSQKSIIIGRNGRMIKKIGQNARIEIERMFSKKVYLELFVKVEKNWTKNTKLLKRLGY